MNQEQELNNTQATCLSINTDVDLEARMGFLYIQIDIDTWYRLHFQSLFDYVHITTKEKDVILLRGQYIRKVANWKYVINFDYQIY